MRIRTLVTGILSLGLVLLAGDSAAAPREGRGSGKTKPGISVQALAIQPDSMSAPVTAAYPMQICVSGFEAGNGVSIHVPWGGTPELHSVLSFGQYVDGTGGFCIVCPPDWTDLRLEPGTYTIRTTWIRSSTDGTSQDGPSSTFQVQPGQ